HGNHRFVFGRTGTAVISFPLWRAEQLGSTRGRRRGLCAWDTLSVAPFAGTGAKTRSDVVEPGADDSDSAPSYARREPSQSRSRARCVCPARSSSTAASSRQAAQGIPEKETRHQGAAFFWLLFLAAQEK